MNGKHNVAYIRVSSLDQNTDRQLDELKKLGEFDRVFEEKASAKDTQRPKLQACLEHLRKGDMLHVHSIDRLARNLFDLQDLVKKLTAKGVSLRFHKENLTFSGEDNLFQNLQLQMMGAFAEFERRLIKERQREGIASAKKAGKQIGAKKKLTEEQVKEIMERISKGEAKKDLAKAYGISRQTLYTALALTTTKKEND